MSGLVRFDDLMGWDIEDMYYWLSASHEVVKRQIERQMMKYAR